MESLTNNFDYERYSVPFQRGKRWYYSYNEGLKAQSVYYTLEEDAIDSKSRGTLFFDPNTLSDDGTVAVFCPVPESLNNIVEYTQFF